ncbi:MAG: DDE-type integrase/transposase/recombinase [Actinomycetota bacterium]|nr:DDE-type integrase/transposase/recombinase [Actinomycetota bacterium]
MNRLSSKERAQIIRALVEGNSIRATVRMTGFAKNTIVKLLVELGDVCSAYQDEHLRDLPCERLQLDEIWSFVGMKDKNIPDERKGEWGIGDVWTWTAIDADTKLIPSWLVADRSGEAAEMFVRDLASRLAQRVQITTDGHRAYLEAVEAAFGADVDYAQLIKVYGANPEAETRYSPSECIGTETQVRTGDPDPAHISTSYVERQNLTMRMSMRRFTRLTNGFSKKVENLAAAVSLHFMWYNFGRPHSSLGRNTTPAMAAGVTDHVWTPEEIAGLLEPN